MGDTLAIHWAATTHGTWLHGDLRGSWRNGRLIGPDPYLEAENRARMSRDAVVLDADEREIVAGTFGEVVREQRHRIFAATVQGAHLHLILAPLREDVKTVIARLKRRSAAVVLNRRRQLRAAHFPAETAGLYSRPILGRSQSGQDGRAICLPRSLWTAGQFPVFIFDDGHLMNAIEYVRDHNRRCGLPPDPFEWIDPLFPACAMARERYFRSAVCDQSHF
jgi:REP element-mobilizing transposase RayT